MIGKPILDLAPSKINNRNSEGAFIRLRDGKLMFAYSRYRNSGGADDSPADLYAIISENDGETFGEPHILLSCDEVGADTIMSVSLMRMNDDALGVFYLRKQNANHSCMPYLAISYDEGKSFIKHIKIIDTDGYYVLNNDRIIRLSNGRLLMAVAKHEYVNQRFMPGIVYIYFSDDDGKTWIKALNEIKFPDGARRGAERLNCMEPGLAELEDGTIWCYIRTMLGLQYEAFSDDFGNTWSDIRPSPFTSPDSPLCVKKLKNGAFFAVWNPIPNYNGRPLDKNFWDPGRTPLVFSILNSNGDFTPDHKVIESDGKSGFCYTAIYECKNGDILLGYCAGSVEEGVLNRLRIKKILCSEL